MMNRLPLRPRQVNTDAPPLISKVAKLYDKGTSQENNQAPSKQHETGNKISFSADTSDAPKIVDDYSEVIIEERRIGPDGQEHVVQRYIRGKLLGKGGFAKVYLCTIPENGKAFAVKIVPKANLVKPRARQKVRWKIYPQYILTLACFY